MRAPVVLLLLSAWSGAVAKSSEPPTRYSYSCGPNALYLLLKASDNPVAIDELRDAMPPGDQGQVSLQAMSHTATRYGLRLAARRVDYSKLTSIHTAFIILEGALELYTSDSRAVISAGGSGDGAGEMVRWNARTGTLHARFLGCNSKVASLALAPDGKTLASGNVDGTVQLWDPRTGKELASFDAVTAHYLHAAPGHGASVWCLAFSPDGSTLATGSGDMTVKLWDFRAGRVRATLSGHRMGLRAVAYSPNGTLAAGCADGSITLWQPDEGRNLATLRAHQGSITALCFTPDGRTLASASMDGTVRLWQAATGERLLRLEGHSGPVLCAAFDPKGNILASGGEDGTVRLWHAASEQEVERYAVR